MILIFPIVLLVLWQGLIGFLMVFEMFAKSDWSAVDRVLGIQWISMGLIVVVALANVVGFCVGDTYADRQHRASIAAMTKEERTKYRLQLLALWGFPIGMVTFVGYWIHHAFTN